MLLLFLQGNTGLLGAARSCAVLPVEQVALFLRLLLISQNTYHTLSMRAMKHILSLDLQYHCTRKPGELEMTLDKVENINRLLDTFLFMIGPVVIDLFLVCITQLQL